MKKLVLGILLGAACLPVCGQFTKSGVRLGSWIPLNQFPGNPATGSACTGYVTSSGREYAIIGLRNGNAVVEITDPNNARLIQHIAGVSSLWHEVTAYNGFAYCATEGGGGMQILDLRNVDAGVVTLATTFTGSGLSTIHTIENNPASQTLYLNGSNLGGLQALDISNPLVPRFVGSWHGSYVHDSLIITYTEGAYAGKEIAFCCCGSNGVYILDVTNKASMVVMGTLHYTNNGYCHSCSISADHKNLFINDEFDESNGVVSSCTTWVADIQDLTAPRVQRTFTNGQIIIDHNSGIRDNYLFLAAYRGGLRVYDIHDVNTMAETGFFDTYPEGQGFSYDGAWGIWAYFPSKTVIISDIQRGLFVLDPSEASGFGMPLRDLAVSRGSVVSGGLKEMRFSDDLYMVTQAGPGVTSNESASSKFVVGMETTMVTRNLIDLTVEARVNAQSGGILIAALKNISTGLFEQVATWNITTTDATFSMANIAASSYIDANGRVEVQLTSKPAGPILTSGFLTSFDLVKGSVH